MKFISFANITKKTANIVEVKIIFCPYLCSVKLLIVNISNYFGYEQQ